MVKKFLYPVLFLILFNSCGEKLVSYEENLSKSYFPLNIGNTWYYDNLIRSDLYTPANPYLKKIVEKKINLNGKEYFIIANTYDFSGESPSVFRDTIRQENGKTINVIGGMEHIWFDFTVTDGAAYVYNPYPLLPDKKYDVNVEKKGVVQINEDVYYDCLCFFFNVPEFVDEEKLITFSPGVGMIEQVAGEGPALVLNSYSLVDN